MKLTKNKIIYVKSGFFLQLSYIHHLLNDIIEHLLYTRHCFRPWEYSEQNKACTALVFTFQWKKTESNGVKSKRFSHWEVLWIKIVQTREQECPSMGEGKLVLINGIIREGFTDKVVFEKMPDKREWKSKGLSSRNWIIGTENSKYKGKVARLCRTSSNTGRSSFSEFCDLAEGWHWGGGTLSLHSKPCDWCPQKLKVGKRNAEMCHSIVFLIYR